MKIEADPSYLLRIYFYNQSFITEFKFNIPIYFIDELYDDRHSRDLFYITATFIGFIYVISEFFFYNDLNFKLIKVLNVHI